MWLAVGTWQHNDFYTDTNYKLLDPYTKKHAALESAAATHLQCFAGRFALVTSTICKWRCAHRLFLRRSSLLDLYTDSIRRQLSTQCTTHHAALEYAVGTHLQCFANQEGAGHFRTLRFQTDAAPKPTGLRNQAVYSTSARTPIASARGSRHRTSRAAGIRTGASPPVLCLPDAPQLMPHGAPNTDVVPLNPPT